MMHGKGESSKINGSICNFPIETANVGNILTRTAVFNGLILVKLKRYLKYRYHIYVESARPHIVYQALTFLKSRNKCYEDISVTKCLSGEDMLNFSDINENQKETESVISNGKEMNTNNNENKSEAEYASVEDPLNMHRTSTNKTTLISEITNIINE